MFFESAHCLLQRGGILGHVLCSGPFLAHLDRLGLAAENPLPRRAADPGSQTWGGRCCGGDSCHVRPRFRIGRRQGAHRAAGGSTVPSLLRRPGNSAPGADLDRLRATSARRSDCAGRSRPSWSWGSTAGRRRWPRGPPCRGSRSERSTLGSSCRPAAGTADSTEYRLDMCERIAKPRTLADMATRATMERLKAELSVGRSPYTVNSLPAHIGGRGQLGRRAGVVAEACAALAGPLRRSRQGSADHVEEFERMLAADGEGLSGEKQRAGGILLRGLWEAGCGSGKRST